MAQSSRESLEPISTIKTFYTESKTGRHRQTSLVENKNKYIAKELFRRMLEEEMQTGEVSKQWTEQLKEVIATINIKIKPYKPKVFPNKIVRTEKTSKLLDTIEDVQEGRGRKKKMEKNTDETYCSGDSCILLPIDTKVRVQLDVPIDYVSGKRLIGTFRATDVRFSKEPHTISDVVIKPGSPPLYILDDDNTTAYTKNQLQVIGEEKGPEEKAIARVGKIKGVKTYYVQEILDHKTEKKRKYYLVKWKGFKEPTWEPIKIIKEDVPEYVAEYEASLKD